MDNKPKNRAWVKDAAIVFLVILLILTFFSNSIMNRNLTEVATESIGSGTISAKVRGTGKVEANGSYQVKMEKSREIRAVMVKQGDTVEVDDVLFILGEGSADEIEQAQNTLRQLELNYKSAAIGMDSYDSTMDDYNLKKADDKITSAREKLNTAETKLEAAKTDMGSHTEVSEDSLKAASSRIDQAVLDMNEKSKDLKEKEKECDEAIQAANSYLDNLEVELVALDEEYKDLSTSDADYDTKKAEYDNKKAELNQKITDAKVTVKNREDEKITKLADPQAAFNKSEEVYANLKTVYDGMVASAGVYYEKYKAAVDEYNAAKAEYDEAEAAKVQLEYQIKQSKKAVYQAAAQTSLQMQDLKTQIEQAKAKLEELTGGVENEIRAKVAGTVDSVAYTAGSTAPAGEVLCTLTVPDMGYSLSFTVTNDQARRLHTGDSATVTNYYWGSQITATLSGMKTDPKNPQTNKILTFSLEGDVNPGAELTITVGSKSASYDYVVPNGAVRSDSNGTFILIIEAKSSALGNRYIARRMDVEVLASDDTYSAISADLGWGEYVITTSKKPITNGEQVRIAES